MRVEYDIDEQAKNRRKTCYRWQLPNKTKEKKDCIKSKKKVNGIKVTKKVEQTTLAENLQVVERGKCSNEEIL